MEQSKALGYMHELLRKLLAQRGSDLFITVGAPPAVKLEGHLRPLTDKALSDVQVQALVRSVMNDHQLAEFDRTNEANFAINLAGLARFRASAFVQQGSPAIVVRAINMQIPSFDDLRLPETLRDISQTRRGLVIVVGGTGSGKSTTLAAMIGYRNANSEDHIVTIEDPIEFVHRHGRSIVNQREIGVDTESYGVALRNTLRQAPDVILIGEIRDRETMEYGIAFAETGHLCLSTLHANNTNQALDRIINFFPEERRQQLLMDLSLNLKAVVSQRLIPDLTGQGRVPATEVLINTPLMADLIFKGRVREMKGLIAKSRESGMHTFDQALFDLHEGGFISYEDALRNADSVNDLRLRMKLEGSRGPRRRLMDEAEELSVEDETRDQGNPFG